MAKKIVRGVTGVDDIEKFDKTLTNVNDLLSDGQNTYVHTKKGNTELYYNITDAVNKVQSSDDTLTITKDNDTITIVNNTLATKQELALKQDKLNSNNSIGVLPSNEIRQLYFKLQTYTVTNGFLKTHVKSVSQNTSVATAQEEFNFIVKINKGATSATFTLNDNDQRKFTNIMNTYGQDNSVRISGLIFTLSGSSLTVTTANSVNNNYVVTFSDII